MLTKFVSLVSHELLVVQKYVNAFDLIPEIKTNHIDLIVYSHFIDLQIHGITHFLRDKILSLCVNAHKIHIAHVS